MAVGVVAIDDDDRVVLVGQHRYALDAYSWEIPEGGVPAARSPLVGAQRELREETGLTRRDLARARAGSSCRTPSPTRRAVLFVATGLTHGEADPERHRVLEVRWVPFDEALAMTLDGRITDALSVVAIQRVALTGSTAADRSRRA